MVARGRRRTRGRKREQEVDAKVQKMQQWLLPKRNERLNDRAARTIRKKQLGIHSTCLDLRNQNYLLVSFYLHWV